MILKIGRGNQSLETFNQKIKRYNWKVYDKYNGSHNPCSFVCLKCGNIETVSSAKSIYKSKCKNCSKNICLNCSKEFIINNTQGKKTTRKFCYECLPYPTDRVAYNKLYYKYIINKINDTYGNKCNMCGYNKCFEALDFHHINPKEKEFDIAKLIHSNKNWDYINKELSKCILICSNCHREIHAELRNEKDTNNI